jgi:hypothetical protein
MNSVSQRAAIPPASWTAASDATFCEFATKDPASHRTASSLAANPVFVESDSTSPHGKLTQQITPIGEMENLVNKPTDPAHPNFKLPRSRLELSRFAADAIACCEADGRGDLS